MSKKTQQPCDNCKAPIRHGFPVGRLLFCTQGREDEYPMSCLEAYAVRQSAQGSYSKKRR